MTCADEITIRIKDGAYPPGEWLPSFQRISDDLNFGRATVERALAYLASEGIITHVTGNGYHHGEQPDHPPGRKRRTAVRRRYEPGRSEADISALLGNPYITVMELARFLKVSKMTVYRAINEGRIPGVVRLSPRMVRLPSAGVRVYIAECAETPHE